MTFLLNIVKAWLLHRQCLNEYGTTDRSIFAMRYMKQKTKTDCGVACLAMLTGVSWVQARNALNFDKNEKVFLTTKDQMRDALRRLGVVTAKRLTVCKYPERLQSDALLRTNVLASGRFHWAVWDAKKQQILDPYYKRTRPLSCLIVLRRQKPTSI